MPPLQADGAASLRPRAVVEQKLPLGPLDLHCGLFLCRAGLQPRPLAEMHESERIPASNAKFGVRIELQDLLRFRRQLREYRMLSYAPKPVGRVPCIRLLAMQNSVPVFAFGRLRIIDQIVSLFET